MRPCLFFLFLVSFLLGLFSPQTLAHAPDVASARDFVEEVYHLFFSPAHGGLLTREGEGAIITPELRSLIRKSRQLTPAEMVPLLIEASFCDCQDFEAPQVKSIEIGEIRENRTRAEVVLALWDSLPDEIVTIELALLWQDGRWRIDDVFRTYLYEGRSDSSFWSTSLRIRLQADIAESEFFLHKGEEMAKKFLADIFAEYRDGARPDLWRDGENAIVTGNLLERLNNLAAQGGKPNFDPICNCRDYQDIRVERIEFVPLAQKMARATVFFTNAAHPFHVFTQEFELMWYDKETGWRIYDIRSSFLAWLFLAIDDPAARPGNAATPAPNPEPVPPAPGAADGAQENP